VPPDPSGPRDGRADLSPIIYPMTPLFDLGREAHQTNTANGWDVFHPADWPMDGEKGKVRFVLTHMALIHTEVSEATEAVRHRDAANFAEELADILIRVTSVAYGLGINLDETVKAKMAKNRTRGLHYGGKAV
jgi:NTP pyrophosphatase (non-canonical NTP hydrolase)